MSYRDTRILQAKKEYKIKHSFHFRNGFPPTISNKVNENGGNTTGHTFTVILWFLNLQQNFDQQIIVEMSGVIMIATRIQYFLIKNISAANDMND